MSIVFKEELCLVALSLFCEPATQSRFTENLDSVFQFGKNKAQCKEDNVLEKHLKTEAYVFQPLSLS